MMLTKSVKLLVFLSGLFVACIVTAELIGVKLFSLEDTLAISRFNFSFFGENNLSLNLSVGVLPWPIIFILTDVINDYFGLKTVRFISIIAVIFIVIVYAILFLALHTSPETSWWLHSQQKINVPDMQSAFSAIFGQGMNIIFASVIAFFIGQLVDGFLFQFLKRKTGDKWIGLRATGSTLVSQFIDSICVTIIAFHFLSTMSFPMALALACTAYVYKFAVAILSTPLLYLVHFIIEKYLGKENAKQMRAENI